MKKKTNHAQEIKAMAKAMGKDVFPETKLPVKRKKRKKETEPRNMAEKFLERRIIRWLMLKGFVVGKSGESSVYNARYIIKGCADLMVFVPYFGVVFLEVKLPSTDQTGKQPEFEKLCERCNVVYKVVRSVDEAERFLNKLITEEK